MFSVNYMLLDTANNYLVGAILCAVAVVLAAVAIFLSVKVKSKTAFIIANAVSVLNCAVTTFFCFNELVMVGYLISVVALAITLSITCIDYHKNTIYNVSFRNLFIRMLIPIYTAGLMFRPWFAQLDESWDKNMPALGLNVGGAYIFDVNVLSADGRDTVLNIISAIQIVLFLLVFGMQIVLIWREFADPDNAPTWASFGLAITVLGGAFIYGVYTSNNFNIATTMEIKQIFSLEVGDMVDVIRIGKADTNILTAVPLTFITLGVVNRLFYIEKVSEFIDSIGKKKN